MKERERERERESSEERDGRDCVYREARSFGEGVLGDTQARHPQIQSSLLLTVIIYTNISAKRTYLCMLFNVYICEVVNNTMMYK